MIAVRAATIFLFIFSSPCNAAQAEEIDTDIGQPFFVPGDPPAGPYAYEAVKEIGYQEVVDELVTGSKEPKRVCAITLEAIPGDDTETPRDNDNGEKMLRVGDEWFSAGALLDKAARTCAGLE